ncbi:MULTISPECIES: YkvA family protein [Epilithonimonas]|jgi:Uncharacterized conserved protein|uniref:Uncharacterized membrane protein YkvA, DUF1232 family n=1 Tax=Epilithonimonas hungarica TaxID=454006 RepID=A0A1G7VJQ9_9FLAO|nr:MULTISPECIES: DUF1232 domain-containing protein [Epilithonimonas]MDP9957834.1 uncharacterized membrane protein YkvA (DUF1232 family) [Epilithonimonas hungarica]MPS73902.1 DUF1232 domain-containing protein [Chryseobacterium sp.]MPT30085.1 DUF1232 domain-containing protein [Chryseobacterium sp.]SDG59973.1 Uncharacterized membrane protein YkvA, DUF1232 family [Epilithonimonas hungarica]
MKHSKFKLAQEAIKHKGFLQKIPAVFRMIKLYYKGEYKMKFTDILLPALALIYVISPIDIIPDFVPVVGALDDLAILAFAIPLLMKEVDKFLLWESRKNNPNVIDAEIVE